MSALTSARVRLADATELVQTDAPLTKGMHFSRTATEKAGALRTVAEEAASAH